MADAFGNVLHPETGQSIGWAENGKLRMNTGVEYKLDGDKILAEDGTEIGYLSTMLTKAAGSGDLANQLLRRD